MGLLYHWVIKISSKNKYGKNVQIVQELISGHKKTLVSTRVLKRL